jgi:hypothetical protein
MHQGMLLSTLLIMGLLSACGSNGSSQPAGTDSPSPSAAPCIDSADITNHRLTVGKHLRSSIRALRDFDLSASVTALRLAASETRAMADATDSVDEEISTHFLRAADALDEAATSMGEADIDGSTSWISQATNEVEQGVDSISLDQYCEA